MRARRTSLLDTPSLATTLLEGSLFKSERLEALLPVLISRDEFFALAAEEVLDEP